MTLCLRHHPHAVVIRYVVCTLDKAVRKTTVCQVRRVPAQPAARLLWAPGSRFSALVSFQTKAHDIFRARVWQDGGTEPKWRKQELSFNLSAYQKKLTLARLPCFPNRPLLRLSLHRDHRGLPTYSFAEKCGR